MKKFLSIMLAVMMVLSTVSFAAPSVAGSMDAATELPVVDFADVAEEAEDTAELAATAGDKSSYGTLVYSIDFERDDFDVSGFSTAYAQLNDNTITAYMNPAFDLSNATAYTNASGDGFTNAALATEGANTYITGNVTAGYNGFFRMTKYGCAWPEGYYTFAVDVKVPANQAASFAQQCNDTAIAITTISAFDMTNGDWQTVVNQTTNVVNGSDIYGYFVTPNNATAGTISYDNWEVYYRPATVTLTIDGNEYEVSTDAPVSVASLASKVTAPTGYVLSGLSLTEGGELLTGERYYFEDTTLYPTYAKDPNIDPTYGKALFVVDFENAKAQSWYGHTSGYDNAENNHGAWIYDVASSYDARFASPANFRVRFLVNEGTHVDQETKVDGDGNHYNEGTTQTQWPQININNWGNVTGEPGYYTYVFDMKMTGATCAYSTTSAYGGNIVDNFDGVQGVWDKVVVQKEMAAAGNIEGGNIFYFSLEAADKGVAKFAYDNFKLFYKPYTADVTLVYGGEEYVAEDVSTAGVSADSIVAAAGVEIPYGKKAVLSETPDGESVGNVVYLAMDSTYYVSFVADDSISEYGQRLFLIDFEQFDANHSFVAYQKVSSLASDYVAEVADAGITLFVDTTSGKEGGTVLVEDENKYVGSLVGRGWGQFNIQDIKTKYGKDGYYTVVADAYATTERTMSMANNSEGVQANVIDPWCGEANKWDTIVAEYSAPQNEMLTWFTDGDATHPIRFDDIALYYRPASVNLTVVDVYGEEIVYENCDSSVNVDELLTDISAPFGYKVALSAEKNGEPLTGTINLVSDAKLYVVLVEDDKVSMEYGEALVIVDLERESVDGWWGMSQDVANTTDQHGAYVSEVASYYDPRFEGKNFRIRFIANENPRDDQVMAVDANGNHYITGSNTTQYSQVTNTNYGNVQGEAGTYTYMFDVMLGEGSEAMVIGSPKTMIQANTGAIGVWETVITQTVLEADGNLPSGTWANFNFSSTYVATVSFDNAKIYFKPFNATVKLVANGEVVATKTAATSGVLVSELVDGVKVKGYTVTGVKLGTEIYGLEDTVKVPCDCSLELALEVQETPAATPETLAEKNIRVSDPVGIRFQASIAKSEDDSITDYGWIIARADQLGETELTFDFNNIVVGYGRQGGVDKKKFFNDEDDEYAIFSGVLHFSAVEDDGYPVAERLAAKLVARPFTVVDGETLYGEATAPTSIYDVACALYYDENGAWDAIEPAQQEYLDGLMIKVEDAGLDE